ncbi:phage tail sheath C-terminal domain-containing protein [Pedobacter foliorum]|uniref:phage tail sheath family protein n=1 Tax=Pedobacter foliorum TaxID=2739058 RepID=UPI001566DB8B|nr:phage tail sheath C-terminal domain-containing protein [Pedobacter foliorum]NRF38054.1 phage tail sheath family protein [Pedobacter foliorum]
MSVKKSPGVYIAEKNVFPNSIVAVSTAVPAFIGYTEKAINGTTSLSNTPFRISTLLEFETYFGEAPKTVFSFTESEDCSVARTDRFNLYYNLKLFFANGGGTGTCYIVSVGSYSDDLNGDKLIGGIDALLEEQEPTMIVIPEAVCLQDAQSCYEIQKAALKHCGSTQSRVAILDIYDGYKDRIDPSGDVIAKFREQIGTEFLNYGAAYYPWLNTSVVGKEEISFANISNEDVEKFKAVLKLRDPNLANYIDVIGTDTDKIVLDTAHKELYKQSAFYSLIIKEMQRQINLLPPSAAMAGVYSMVDITGGVWEAPANVGLVDVISTAVNISSEDQEDLNIPLDGKAVNAIRYFTGRGILVWGARTLEGNSSDWRYISTRRTMIMIEQSIKNVARAYVFEPNVSSTWITLSSIINNFFLNVWKQGGLAGAKPEQAFFVKIGLGVTMTPQDILDGKIIITVGVAIMRPAEFTIISFQQQMQQS